MFLKDLIQKILCWARTEENPELEVQKILKDYDDKLENLKHALANLLFQQARLLEKKQQCEHENLELKSDLEDCVRQSQSHPDGMASDQLSLQIIEQIESNSQEIEFYADALAELEQEISQAKSTKTQLEQGMIRYREKVKTMDSRIKTLKARQQVKEEIGNLQKQVKHSNFGMGNHLEQLNKKLLRLNIDLTQSQSSLDGTQSSEASFEQQISQFRKKRQKDRHGQVLDQIKRSVNQNSKNIVVS
jgi:phage shock protein A